MGRKSTYPPKIYAHKRSGRDRIRWGGHDYWLGKSGSDEAKSRYRQLLAEIDRHGAPLPKTTATAVFTIEQLVDWWLGWAPKAYRATSREPRLFREPLAVLRKLAGPTAAADFGAARLKAVRDALGERYCRNVANRHLVRVKTLFRRAGEEGIIPEAVYGRLLVVRAIPPGSPGVRETEPVTAADDADLEKVMRHCPAPVAALLTVARLSGMRPAEGRLMRADQVERRPDGSMVYRRTPADGHKTAYLGRTRVVVIGPRAARVLSPWLYAADGWFVFRPVDAPKSRGRAGLSPHYSACTLSRAVARAAKAAGVRLTPRELRHSFKLDAITAGGIAAAMQAMGQTTSKAFDNYGKTGPKAAKGAEEIARLIG